MATDVAARGIDVEAIGHVVNFDVPRAADDYVHRIGRTARAGTVGEALTFVAPEEEEDIALIERALKKSLPRVTVPGFDYGRRGSSQHGGRRHDRGRPQEPSAQALPTLTSWHGIGSGGSGRPRRRRR